jgi:hypothetical protein
MILSSDDCFLKETVVRWRRVFLIAIGNRLGWRREERKSMIARRVSPAVAGIVK